MEPVSRIELLAAGVQIEPVSRLEKFVAAAAGTYELPADLVPVSRLEYFLSQIAGGGGTPGEGTLIKANTLLYLSNLSSTGSAGTFNLRPTLSYGNPFNKEGFYLRAKISSDGTSYSNGTTRYLTCIGGTINAINSGNQNTILFYDRFYEYGNVPYRAGVIFQGETVGESYFLINSESEFYLTIDSLTINDTTIELGELALTVLNNIADLSPTQLKLGYALNSNFATKSILNEFEIGVIST